MTNINIYKESNIDFLKKLIQIQSWHFIVALAPTIMGNVLILHEREHAEHLINIKIKIKKIYLNNIERSYWKITSFLIYLERIIKNVQIYM